MALTSSDNALLVTQRASAAQAQGFDAVMQHHATCRDESGLSNRIGRLRRASPGVASRTCRKRVRHCSPHLARYPNFQLEDSILTIDWRYLDETWANQRNMGELSFAAWIVAAAQPNRIPPTCSHNKEYGAPDAIAPRVTAPSAPGLVPFDSAPRPDPGARPASRLVR